MHIISTVLLDFSLYNFFLRQHPCHISYYFYIKLIIYINEFNEILTEFALLKILSC